MSIYTASVDEDHNIETGLGDILSVEDARTYGTALHEAAEKAAEAIEAKAEEMAKREALGVFLGAKPGDLFLANDGTVFVLADASKLYRSGKDAVVLWRIKDQWPTYADLPYWKREYGITSFAKVTGTAGLLTETTIDRRDAFIVGEGAL